MFWLLALLAYLLGSLSFAIVLSRLTGSPDPRSSGSGNAGATNMLRLAGRKLAILTLLGDLCKGLLPVLLARLAGLDLHAQAGSACARCWATCSRCTSASGRQGRGDRRRHAHGPLLPGRTAGHRRWLLTFYLTRTSSLAALIATPLTLPLLAWREPEALLPITVLTAMIVWRHRSNLRDLFAGRERHF